MIKWRIIFLALMYLAATMACNNSKQQSSTDSTAIGPAKDTGSTTKLPDTMYDNVNQDSIP